MTTTTDRYDEGYASVAKCVELLRPTFAPEMLRLFAYQNMVAAKDSTDAYVMGQYDGWRDWRDEQSRPAREAARRSYWASKRAGR